MGIIEEDNLVPADAAKVKLAKTSEDDGRTVRDSQGDGSHVLCWLGGLRQREYFFKSMGTEIGR